MLAGELYLASDPELVKMRHRARRLMHSYNQSTGEDSYRKKLLYDLFGRVGPKVTIEPPFYCDYGSNIYVADDLLLNFGCVILDCAEVHIGEGVMCGPYVQIYTASHPLDASLRAAGPEFARPIRIGNRVWIGGGAIILPGVTIGGNTTIGAGSVVTKDIPPNVFAAGNPCIPIRQL